MTPQQQRLLTLFVQNKTLTNFQLRALQPPIFQYPVRIKELRAMGYDISGNFDQVDKRKYVYTLISEPGQSREWTGTGKQIDLINVTSNPWGVLNG